MNKKETLDLVKCSNRLPDVTGRNHLYLYLTTPVAKKMVGLEFDDEQSIFQARVAGYTGEAQVAEYFLNITGVEKVALRSRYTVHLVKGGGFAWKDMVEEINAVLEAIEANTN